MSEVIASLEADLADAAEACRRVLSSPLYAGLDALPTDAPPDADAWFELLLGYPYDPASDCLETLLRLKAALPAEAAAGGAKIGHFALLNALLAALARISGERVPDEVKHEYATFCREIAARESHWEPLFDFEEDPRPFQELAEFATLRTFPLGDLSFGIGNMPLLGVIPTIHPLSLPGFLCEAFCAMKGSGLTIYPHFNYGRRSLLQRRGDYEKALWLIAKTVEMRPEVKGLRAVSWLHSSVVGKVYPHLAWMRDLFLEVGAYVIDTRPAPIWRYGFHYKNPKRLKLYEQGKFCPRHTLVLWPRQDLLEWAAKHPELAPAGAEPIDLPDAGGPKIRIPSPASAPQTKSNSGVRLWDSFSASKRLGRKWYLLLTFVLPVLATAAATGAAFGWGAVLPGFVVAAMATHAFQYYFTQ